MYDLVALFCRIHLEPKGNIEQSLTDGLKLLCDKKKQERFITRLDARYNSIHGHNYAML